MNFDNNPKKMEKLADTLEKQRKQKLEKFNVDEDEILELTQNNVKIWTEYHSENIKRGEEDSQFLTNKQWTDQEEQQFINLHKVSLSFNKLEDAVKKINGEYRKNKMDLAVFSSSGNATESEIELRENMLRSIAYNSQSDLVYQQAFDSALRYGFGAFRIGLEYESPMSFNKIIKAHTIRNPMNAFFDPRSELPHMGDGNFAAHGTYYNKDEFETTFGIEFPQSYQMYNTDNMTWSTDDSIIVLDQYVKEWTPITLYRLDNGQSVTKDEYNEIVKEYELLSKQELSDAPSARAIMSKEVPQIVGKRESSDYKIMHYRLIQGKIIDVEEWPSKILPVFFVPGNFSYLRGKIYTKSFIHDAKDAQKFINYVGSEIANDIKNRRREQWIATAAHIESREQMWRNPEIHQGALIASVDPILKSLPQRLAPSEIPQTLLAQFQRGTADIKEILGFFEANAGQESNEISGKAIQQRQLAGSLSATIFFDNLASAIEQSGRAILDLMPSVYMEPNRDFRITKPDGDTKYIKLNKTPPNPNGENNNITSNPFDIEVSASPSFGVQKQQTLDFLLQLININPQQIFPLVADFIAKLTELTYTPQLVSRLKTLVPQNIIDEENGVPPAPPPPNPQVQMMQQEIQMKQQEIQIKQQELQLKQEKLMLDKEQLQYDFAIAHEDQHSKNLGHMSNMHDAQVKQETEMMKLAYNNANKNNDNK